MKKSLEIALNIGYWICYALIILLIISALGAGGNQLDKFSFILKVILCFVVIPSVVSYYTNYFLVFPKFIHLQKWKKGVFFFILSIVLACIINSLCMTVFVSSNSMLGPTVLDTAMKFLFIAILAFLNGILAMVIKGFVTWYQEINLKRELSDKNRDMELALVKAKTDPHFLFNSLNNLDTLIQKDQDQASLFTQKLAEILRFSIYKSASAKVLLSEEIDYLKRYIDLQKIRSANLDYVKFDVVGDIENLSSAPMVYIPFVENAFKYTNNKKVDSAIDIRLIIENRKIHFTCKNKFEAAAIEDSDSNGLGNDLIKRRLVLLYPGKHQLNISNENGIYTVDLTIHES